MMGHFKRGDPPPCAGSSGSAAGPAMGQAGGGAARPPSGAYTAQSPELRAEAPRGILMSPERQPLAVTLWAGSCRAQPVTGAHTLRDPPPDGFLATSLAVQPEQV